MIMQRLAAEFIDVTKVYRRPLSRMPEIHALLGVSLTVQHGEVLALLGPNRAGKTTLLKILLGLCHPTGGRVVRLGAPLSRVGTLGRVGYMHENQVFPRHITASSLLGFYGHLSRLSAGILRTRVPDLLEKTGLADRAHEPISRFSKGMVRRLALAQAMLTDPELLVLDEPTEGLDLGARELLLEAVADRRRAGNAVLLVSHALAEVAKVSDRVAVLVEGRLAFLGPLASLVGDAGNGGQLTLEVALSPIYCS
jgi:ABC-2 type transport system ATP-binding protein